MRQVLLWWILLGFPLSWNKSQCSKEVTWIGASIRIIPDQKAFAVGIPKDKTDALVEPLEKLVKEQVANKEYSVNMAGKIEWMAGVLPQLKPFNQVFWAALARCKYKQLNIYYKQVK